jgi:hypothetical protein
MNSAKAFRLDNITRGSLISGTLHRHYSTGRTDLILRRHRSDPKVPLPRFQIVSR